MFHAKQNDLVAGLNWLARHHCSYRDSKDPNKRVVCDCKFGIANGPSCEVSGCPELSSAADLINALTSTEYQQLCRRAREMELERAGLKPSNKVFVDERELHVHCPICRHPNVFDDDGKRRRVCAHCHNTIVFAKGNNPKPTILTIAKSRKRA